MYSSFIHLRLHTEFSLVDSCIRLDCLVRKVKEESMPAVAITDFHNLFALVKFYKKARLEGIKPIIGVDFSLQQTGSQSQSTNLLLLAQNLIGYKNLIKLISRSYKEGQKGGKPHILDHWLEEDTDGLIALSGAQKGAVGAALSARRLADAKRLLKHFMNLFPDRFYIELQRTSRYGEEEYIEPAIHLANELGCPVVATNDVCFLDAGEFEAHEARVCINEGRTLEDPRRDRRYSDKQFLRSADDMTKLFEDIPEAIANSVEIAKRCSLEIDLGKYSLPKFTVPENISANDYFINLSETGLQERLLKRQNISPIRHSKAI
jgi:DNA polymerase-3 subunit alpha